MSIRALVAESSSVERLCGMLEESRGFLETEDLHLEGGYSSLLEFGECFPELCHRVRIALLEALVSDLRVEADVWALLQKKYRMYVSQAIRCFFDDTVGLVRPEFCEAE